MFQHPSPFHPGRSLIPIPASDLSHLTAPALNINNARSAWSASSRSLRGSNRGASGEVPAENGAAKPACFRSVANRMEITVAAPTPNEPSLRARPPVMKTAARATLIAANFAACKQAELVPSAPVRTPAGERKSAGPESPANPERGGGNSYRYLILTGYAQPLFKFAQKVVHCCCDEMIVPRR